MQGVVNSKVAVPPLVHLAQVVEVGAWVVAGGAAVGLAVMLMIRLLGGSWTFGLLAVAVAPSTWLYGWQAGVALSVSSALANRSQARLSAVTKLRRRDRSHRRGPRAEA